MSEDLIELVDRATHDAAWDADRLVAGAVATGRSRLRRRRAGAALVTCAVLGVAGTGLALSDRDGDVSRGVDPAGQSEASVSPTPTPTPTSTPAVEHWQIGVEAMKVPATFAEILPGVIGVPVQKEMNDQAPIIDFTWNGYAVRVGVTPDDRATGQRVPDPLTRCRTEIADIPCVPGQAPGSYEQTSTWTGPAVDGGATIRDLTVYFAEGWDITVVESNAADLDDGSPIATDLPLTLDQLRTVAYSPLWFR